MDIVTVSDVVCELGESPVWHVARQQLFWVDIVGCQLHAFDPVSLESRSWLMPAMIGCVAPSADGGLIAAMGDGVYLIDLPSGKRVLLCKVPGNLRLNDGKCDRAGRFWFGSVDTESANGCLYCYDQKNGLQVKETGVFISNGLGWSPDNRIFYYTDSPTRCIFAYNFDLNHGVLSNKRIFVKTANSDGEPDGLTVDIEGYVWSAQWNAGKVYRYSPAGEIDQVITMPVSRPTSCMFGGKNKDILYMTSCSRDVGEQDSLAMPAGQLFAMNVKVIGQPEGVFLP